MSASMRGFRAKNVTHWDRQSSDQSENIGNRKTFEETKIPSDNVGNCLEHDPITTFVHDGLGNSLDDEPSHLKSGILTNLAARDRSVIRRNGREPVVYNKAKAIHSNLSSQKMSLPIKKPLTTRGTIKPVAAVVNANGKAYMDHLTNEFAKLLREKAGLPFSFSMKPVTDSFIDEQVEQENLQYIKLLIDKILNDSNIAAGIAVSQYRTSNHRFAVFFINPAERDPIKNKELISALRQIIKIHIAKNSLGPVNVLLVLANAQNIIESHLQKIGAKKVID